ncbi:unnamed protein product [Musa acuminata var. zebrina]
MASDNKFLGEFNLTGIPPSPRGMPQIEEITIRSSGGLSEEEIEKMVKAAEIHAQKDQERKSLIDIKNTADTTIYSIEKSLGEFRDKIPREVAKEIEDSVADLRAAMSQQDNAEKIKEKMEAANEAVSKIGRHMQQGGGGGGGSSGSASEADYKEAKM